MNRLLVATLALSFAVAGCTKEDAGAGETPAGLPFEVLAGGGQVVAAKRTLDTALTGRVMDLESHRTVRRTC